MKRNLNRGSSTLEGLMLLLVLGFIIMAFIIPSRAPKSLVGTNSNSNGSSASNSSNNSYYNTDLNRNSPLAKSISLGSGNASRAYQTYEEYVTIDNRSNQPVNITGWILSNAKDERVYELGGGLKHFSADTTEIPRATLILSPTGNNIFQSVVLGKGESAIITTGTIGVQTPYKIVSFKENICTGYLGDMSEYTFTPSLTRNCPRPSNEAGTSSLDTACRDFIGRMQSCNVPTFDRQDKKGEDCSTCVNGIRLSSSCVAFIRAHYSYAGCVANHTSDQNFSGRTWRIFLGQGWEMWANDHDVIKLFDQAGKLVDFKSY
ncbi:MAG: hypothetical protein ABIF06_00745 [bacterium]